MFAVAPPAFVQRIIRAKASIRDVRVPCEVPLQAELPARLDRVLRVIYSVSNEGCLASAGDSLTRTELSGEAIRLGRLLAQLLPEPESIGLLALMLMQASRRLGGDCRSLRCVAAARPVAGSRAQSRAAVAMHDGAAAGLAAVDAILARGELADSRRLLRRRGPGPERGDPDGHPAFRGRSSAPSKCDRSLRICRRCRR
ncbi:DUF6596 domain-containing protein [Aromatoleum aromaticum]|uniref:DUF6596 domain-containing protein n=1 Tax=Aromatoleum aromaticum TaxID=551760 RepID=UPI0031F438FA